MFWSRHAKRQAGRVAPLAAAAETTIQRLIREHDDGRRIFEARREFDDYQSDPETWESASRALAALRADIARAKPVDFDDLKRKAVFTYYLCDGYTDDLAKEDLDENRATIETLSYVFVADFIRAFGSNIEPPASFRAGGGHG